MEPSERDTTRDWLLPEGAAPPLLGELEARVDEALETARAAESTAKAAEASVVAVGEAALDAVHQASRAAEAAERASAVAADANERALQGPPEDRGLRSFSERADRVVARLRALERLPRRPGAPSAGAGRRRGGG